MDHGHNNPQYMAHVSRVCDYLLGGTGTRTLMNLPHFCLVATWEVSVFLLSITGKLGAREGTGELRTLQLGLASFQAAPL